MYYLLLGCFVSLFFILDLSEIYNIYILYLKLKEYFIKSKPFLRILLLILYFIIKEEEIMAINVVFLGFNPLRILDDYKLISRIFFSNLRIFSNLSS